MLSLYDRHSPPPFPPFCLSPVSLLDRLPPSFSICFLFRLVPCRPLPQPPPPSVSRSRRWLDHPLAPTSPVLSAAVYTCYRHLAVHRIYHTCNSSLRQRNTRRIMYHRPRVLIREHCGEAARGPRAPCAAPGSLQRGVRWPWADDVAPYAVGASLVSEDLRRTRTPVVRVGRPRDPNRVSSGRGNDRLAIGAGEGPRPSQWLRATKGTRRWRSDGADGRPTPRSLSQVDDPSSL